MTGLLRLKEIISTKLRRVAEISRRRPDMVWTTLAHHIDVEFLLYSYRSIRKTGAVGVDGVTAADYEVNLESNLITLCERFRKGTYRAPPVRRVNIPKGAGKYRPIGIPTLEDKILQHAVAQILGAVYEQDFLPCSFGFRPARSAHGALAAVREQLMSTWGGWVIDLDVESFFDSLDHKVLRGFLDLRIRDGVIRRAIGKWLNAGALENGAIIRTGRGSPQGGVISPLLANIYLHHVLDLWFAQVVQPRMRYQTKLVRYADDAVMIFESRADAERVMAVLGKRFAKYGLRLHPDKTRLVPFKQPPRRSPSRPTRGVPKSFDFLGFTHYWGRSRRGAMVVQRKTSRRSFGRSVRSIWEWCRRNRHLPVVDQQRALHLKLVGHFQYFGITGNSRALEGFAYEVRRAWQYWLTRRSSGRHMPWSRFNQLLKRYPLPVGRVCVHL